MEEIELLDLAKAAFDAIEAATGKCFWKPESGLQGAISGFKDAYAELGLGGLMDAATGSGMSRLGLAYWLEKVNAVAKGEQ